MTLSTWPRAALSLLCGAALVLGFAPVGWYPLLPLLLALWLWSLRAASPRQAAWQGFCLGWGLYLAGVSWVYVSIHTFGGAPAWLAVLLVLFLSAYLASFLAVSMGLAWWLAPAGAVRLLLALPACWLLGEHLRGWVFDGFPWLSLGYALSPAPGASGLVALGGVLLLGWVLWSLAAALGLLLERRWWPAALAVVPLGLGAALAPPPSQWTQVLGEPLRVALVQGNIEQQNKWKPDNLLPTLEMYDGLTRSLPEADLVIWPEVAIPASLYRVQPWFDAWQVEAAERGQTVLAGVITRVDQHPYNTVYALGPQPGRYVKQHLVPFGEYFPVPDWVRPIFDWLDLPFSDIRTDLPSDRFLRVGTTQIAMSICFEDLFPADFARQADGSQLLVNVTNDAWFAGSLAPWQHLQIARVRAAETGRPLLRVANTGISAHIDADGGLQGQIDWGQRAVLEVDVQPRSGHTPYMHWQDRPLSGLAALLLLLLLCRHVVRISHSRASAPELS